MAQNIVLSTGDIKRDYDIVEIIHAAQVIRSWWTTTGGREMLKFLPDVNNKLRTIAAEKGCDAVIWIDYDFTREESTGITGKKSTAIIMAYGTGVKFK